MGKGILITVGAGILGFHLCELLLNVDNDIICAGGFFTGDKASIIHQLDNPYFELLGGVSTLYRC